MKKLVLAIAIVLGMGIGAYAQGGLFKYGQEAEQTRGGGALLLIGFGAAYALKKRNEK